MSHAAASAAVEGAAADALAPLVEAAGVVAALIGVDGENEAGSGHESHESEAGGDGEAPDREDEGADAPEAVAPPANPPAPANPAPAAPAPAAPAPGDPPAPGNGARRRAALPLLDLDALKQDRANLKRQLRECAKNVKAQARRVKFLVLPLSNFFAVFAS